MYELNEEKLVDILEEVKSLFVTHAKEVDYNQDSIKLNPDYDKYVKLEELGMLLVVTVRWQGVLVGYNINFLSPHLHYKDHIYAQNDAIYLAPEHRGGGVSKGLLNVTEALLKYKGVSVVTINMKVDHPFTSLVEKLGFEKQEYVYSKTLGD